MHIFHAWESISKRRLEVNLGWGAWGVRGHIDPQGGYRRGDYRWAVLEKCGKCATQREGHYGLTEAEWRQAQLESFGVAK